MAEQLYSPLWYRVSGLRPALRSHTRVHRHVYRGEPWFVIEDLAAHRVHRFTPAAYRIISMLDGQRSMQDVWQQVDDELGDDAPTQDDIVQLLGKLHGADLLRVETPADTRELLKRHDQRRRKAFQQKFANPLSMRWALLDPDKLLTRLSPYVRPVFSRAGLLVWTVVVLTALLMAARHWTELTANMSDRVLSTQNLLVLWLVYPVIKLFHELGHGLTVKRWRGEVHEAGVMLLVMAPVPYVDASAAAAFRDKHKRMLVGAAGIMVELFIAALAMFVWVAAEPGLVRAVAYNTMLIGAISTVVFNGNPLLRFDAYYVLADLIDIPNLGQRANRYVGYLVQRYAFGIEDCESPARTESERPWLLGYSVLSFFYRMLVLFGIVMFISDRFFVFGILLAVWAITMQVAWPLIRQGWFLLASQKLNRQRPRAIAATGAFVLSIIAGFFWIPVPLSTFAHGVVWAPDQAELRAGADGVVTDLLVLPEAQVAAGAPILALEDPLLGYEVRILEADLAEARSRYHALRTTEPVQAAIIADEMNTIGENLSLARSRLEDLTVRSRASGNVVLERPSDLVNRFVRNGDLLGYVADFSNGRVRVAVSQDDVGLIRERTDSVWVRLSEAPEHKIRASVTRAVPAAMDRLPSPVLGTAGGGPLPVDPTDEDGTRTLESVFHVELEIPAAVDRIGGRAYVRFDHGAEPLAQQAYRRLRQLFLRQFDA